MKRSWLSQKSRVMSDGVIKFKGVTRSDALQSQSKKRQGPLTLSFRDRPHRPKLCSHFSQWPEHNGEPIVAPSWTGGDYG